MRPGVIGPYISKNTANVPTSEYIKTNTQNIGNLMFRYAVCKDLDNKQINLDTKMDVGFVRENVDIIVMPLANNVNPHFNMGYLGNFIEKCDLPTIVVGLGAQASLGKSLSKELPKGSQRFLDVISERSSQIGIRGSFTGNILYDLGVKNTTICGCPSNFINSEPKLGSIIGEKLTKLKDHNPAKVAIYSQLGGSNFNVDNMVSENQLFEMVHKNDYHYVHNFPKELIDYSRGGTEVSKKWKKNFHKHLGKDTMTFNKFNRIFRKKSFSFTTIESWMEFSNSCDVSIGKRVHGAINTLQSGTPGILIIHDERTKELAETIGIPHVTSSVFDSSPLSIKSFVESCEFDQELFDSKRKALYKNYKRIFEKSKVTLHNKLPL